MTQSPSFKTVLCLVVLVTATVIGLSGQQRGGGGGAGRGAGIPGQPPAGRGQQPSARQQPTFRAETSVVLVDFRVVDGDGQFVRGLTRDDIQVFEEDAAQTITSFELVDIPVDPPSPVTESALISPDVASNEGAEDGRLYVLVLDDTVTSDTFVDGTFSSREDSVLRAPTVRALAREFVERHMGPDDRAAVMTMSGRRDIASEFTGDRARLVASIETFEGNFGQNTPNACMNLRLSIRSLTSLAGWLSQIAGRRKAIVLITHQMGSDAAGYDMEALRSLGCEGDELVQFVEASARGNVATYIIDPVGAPGGPASGIKPVFVDTPANYSASRRQGLVAVSEATGGFAFVNSNEFTQAFTRVVVENSSYYMLGYTPTDPDLDGKFRRIRVAVNRPGLTVRARTGYIASDRQYAQRFYNANLPATLNNALQSPVGLPGLVMSLSAMPLRGNGSRAIVPVLIGVEDPPPGPNSRTPQRPLDLVLAAADKGGSVKDSRRLKVDGQRLLVRLDLSPGRYHVRAAAVDASGQLHGSVLYDFDVPDFSKGPLGMSGLVLASAADRKRQITGFDEQWQKLLRVPPTTTRKFAASDELESAFEIYDHENRAAHRIDVTATVTRVDGSVAHRSTAVEERAAGGPRPVTLGRVMAIPLKELTPGSYTLTVEAQSSVRADTRISRQVPFEVR